MDKKIYKLIDGSLSVDYEVGDEFRVAKFNSGVDIVRPDEKVIFHKDDNSLCPMFLYQGKTTFVRWECLKPTKDTQRKAHHRKTGKWLVLVDDLVVHSSLSLEQYEQWVSEAKDCGFESYRGVRYDERFSYWNNSTINKQKGIMGYQVLGERVDTTKEFLQFLEKKGGVMEQFTKDNLKDGDYLLFEDGSTGYWLNGQSTKKEKGKRIDDSDIYQVWTDIDYYTDDLKQKDGLNIDKVKRNGIVVFERKEENVELTMKEISEKFNVPLNQLRIKE